MDLSRRLALGAAARGLRLLGASQRVDAVGEDPFEGTEPFVVAFWHNALYAGVTMLRDRGVVFLVSPARAGDRLSGLLERLGYGPSVRGSTSRRRMAALGGMIRAVRQGRRVAVTVDGGRGPAGHVRPGVLAVASATGCAVWPLGMAVRPCLRVRSSWETVIVPLPFSRIVRVFEKPMRVPRGADDETLESSRVQLERALHVATSEAERIARQGGRLNGRPTRSEA